MIIKSADDKTQDIALLKSLLEHPQAGLDTRRKIEQEIRFMQSGIAGEKEAAYEIDFHYGTSKNWAILHDLRMEHQGRVAQIDHLIINRFLDVWVCESKNFSEGIAINQHGECSAFFGGKPYGVPSPFEQNRKHCFVFQAMCEDGVVPLPRRLGFAIKPNIQSLVLVSKRARITRPKGKVDALEEILKVDQIKARIDKAIDGDNNPLQIVKVISSETLEEFSKSIAVLHKPIVFDWHAKFGLQKKFSEDAGAGGTAVKAMQTVAAYDATISQEDLPKPEPEPSVDEGKQSKLVCVLCSSKVSYTVAKFCWNNKARFGGKVYCMDCQKKVQAAS